MSLLMLLPPLCFLVFSLSLATAAIALLPSFFPFPAFQVGSRLTPLVHLRIQLPSLSACSCLLAAALLLFFLQTFWIASSLLLGSFHATMRVAASLFFFLLFGFQALERASTPVFSASKPSCLLLPAVLLLCLECQTFFFSKVPASFGTQANLLAACFLFACLFPLVLLWGALGSFTYFWFGFLGPFPSSSPGLSLVAFVFSFGVCWVWVLPSLAIAFSSSSLACTSSYYAAFGFVVNSDNDTL